MPVSSISRFDIIDRSITEDTNLSWDLFQKVDHYVSNQLSIIETGRMPWHDVHMTITGPSVLDISQHYIERWNEVKKRKVRTMSLVVV